MIVKEVFYNIEKFRHIELVVEQEYLCVASALYSYILTKHKKVSLVCFDKNLKMEFSFLPWFDKIKSTPTPSADISLEIKLNFKEVFEYLKDNGIKINVKMATALYGALVYETDGFSSKKVDGIVFAYASELIGYKAEYKLAQSYIVERTTLSCIRLKAVLFKNMILKNDATQAVFSISEDELKSCGAILSDCYNIIQEAQKLPYIKDVLLLDEESNIIKILN